MFKGIIVNVFLVFILSCTDTQGVNYLRFSGDVSGPQGFWAKIDDGTEFFSYIPYDTNVRSNERHVIGPETTVDIDVGENISNQLETVFGMSQSSCANSSCSQGLAGYFGPYVFSVGPAKWGKKINGCIAQKAEFELSVRLAKASDTGPGTLLWDYHFAVYKKDGYWCIGVYKSATGQATWDPNWCTCTNDLMR